MTVVTSLDDPVRHNREMEGRSRREWIRSQRLPQRPAALAAERMDPATEKGWNDWLNGNIKIALRGHAKQTQEFVVSLIRENNRNLMKVISGLKAEVDQLRKQLEDKTHV